MVTRPFMRCAVLGCARVRGARKGDPYTMEEYLAAGCSWVCGDHWKTVRPALKVRWKKLQRLEKRATARHAKAMTKHNYFAKVRIQNAADRAWRVCRDNAIEIAMGISG